MIKSEFEEGVEKGKTKTSLKGDLANKYNLSEDMIDIIIKEPTDFFFLPPPRGE